MTPLPLQRADLQGSPAERGFVLIGVVMFVLALTILGLSLFALSSYEAQFAGRAYDSERALDVAQSGIEHAKFVLARRQTLQDVSTSLYPAGIIYARARRTDGNDPDTVASLGDIPDTVAVEIRVLADVNGTRRMLQANYLPKQGLPIYKRLMTVTNSLVVRDSTDSDHDTACFNSYFTGEVLHGDAGGIPCGNFTDRAVSNALPQPDISGFLAQHLAGATPLLPPVPASPPSNTHFVINLNGSGTPEKVRYVKTIADPNGRPYSLYFPRIAADNGEFTLNVNGWVVWMLPNGFRSLNKVVIRGTGIPPVGGIPHDCLVIVAGPSLDLTSLEIGTPSVWFDNTLDVQNIPVIVVTNGWFGYEHSFASFWNLGETINYFTLFAHSAFWGAGDGDMRLKHLPNDPYDAPDALIDKLCEQGALPNSQAGGIKFKPITGTWIELPPPSN